MKIKDVFAGLGRKKKKQEAPQIDPAAWPTPENLEQWEAMQQAGMTPPGGVQQSDASISWPVQNGVGETSGWDASGGGEWDAAAGWPSPDDAGAAAWPDTPEGEAGAAWTGAPAAEGGEQPLWPEGSGAPTDAGAAPPEEGDSSKKKKKKEKKPKKEKKRKGKESDGGGAEGEEGEKKRRNPTVTLIMILVPVIIVTAAATVLIILRPWEKKPAKDPADGEPTQTEQSGDETDPDGKDDKQSDGQTGKTEDKQTDKTGDDKSGEQTGEQSGEQTGEQTDPSNGETPLEQSSQQLVTPTTQPINTVEALELFGNFSPSSIGLSGDSMSAYRFYTTGKTVTVDGIPCMEIMVYSENESADTNDYAGRYFMSRGTTRKLFRDMGDGVVEELSPTVIGLGN